GAPVGQLFQPAAATAGENQSKCAPREPLLGGTARQHLRLPLSGRSAACRPCATRRCGSTARRKPRGQSVCDFAERLQLCQKNRLVAFEAVELDQEAFAI